MESYSQATVNTEASLFELQIDHEANPFLTEAAKWARFLAIVGFVFIGLMLINLIRGGSNLYFLSSTMGAGGFISVAVTIGFMAAWFFANLYLLFFANKILFALRNTDQNSLNAGFNNLRLSLRVAGILTIVVLSMMIIAFLVVLIMFGR